MSVVFPNIAMDQFVWKRNECQTDQSDVQVGTKVLWPSILTRTDRGGLNTWLATRKAESDKKREEENKENPWLQKNQASSIDLGASIKKGLLSCGGVEEIVDRRDSLRVALMMAWGGPVKTQQAAMEKEEPLEKKEAEPEKEVELWLKKEDLTAVPVPEHPMDRMYRSISTSVKPTTTGGKHWTPSSMANEVREGLLKAGDVVDTEEKPTICHPMQRMHSSIYSSVQGNPWIIRDEKNEKTAQTLEVRIPEVNEYEETKESRVESLRRTLLSAWTGEDRMIPDPEQKDPEDIPEVFQAPDFSSSWLMKDQDEKTEIPQNTDSSTSWLIEDKNDEKLTESWDFSEVTKNEETNPSRAESLRKSLLSAWTGDDVSIAESGDQDDGEEKASIAEELKRSMMSIGSDDDNQTWVMDEPVDDTESEASIMTLEYEEYDDFKDMEHELCQWITKA